MNPWAVNRKLFPDEYREWRDSVWRSILHMGTPWAYNQSFVASYRAPFNRLPALDFLSANVSYNATYRWDRGATIDGENMGNSIANQAAWNVDSRLNFEGFYNKIPYLKKVNQRFASKRRSSNSRTNSRNRGKNETSNVPKAKRFERTFTLNPDTSIIIQHNLRTKKVKVTAKTVADDTPFAVRTRVIDANSIEVLTRGDQNIKFTVLEVLKEDKNFWTEAAQYATRFLMSPRSISFRWRDTRNMNIPLFAPEIGNIFGQSRSYGPMSPGLDFAFGFVNDNYINTAKERGWLMSGTGQSSPAISSHSTELNLELNLEPIKGLKIQLTGNRTDSRSRQIQFMYADMPTSLSGSYTKTHCAIATSLKSSSAENGYQSAAFDQFLSNIPVIARRVSAQYEGKYYPTGGFMADNPHAGALFNPQVGDVSQTGSDVLIPAFLAAYTGVDANKQYLDPFPSFAKVLPNWRITYDGIVDFWNLRKVFKTFTLSHAYQCTYTVGSYSSYLNWLSVDGGNLGFTLDAITGQPIPSSPYNISSVAINERFAPLIGLSATLQNDITFNAEYREQRTLTLNTSAGQVVEANSKGITAGFGYKIVGFNTVLKMKGSQQGISNDLNIKGDFSYALNQALIRRIESNYTQATSGSRTIGINLTANYILSRNITVGMYFEHQINTPIVSANSYPTTNTAYGISINLSLAR